MRINRIAVKKLFGIFDHEIPLNTKDHITIIHGPNGFGKTILLTLINEVFNSQYEKLFEIPFNELIICFDDNSRLCLKKNGNTSMSEGKKMGGEISIILEFSKPGSKTKTSKIESINPERRHFPGNFLERILPSLEKINETTWLYLPTGEQLSLYKVLDRFRDSLPSEFLEEFRIIDDESWFKKIKESIDIHFIETQRLLRVSQYRITRELEERRSMIPAVLNYSNELAKAIRERLEKYGTTAQLLDRTFPIRLVKEKKEQLTKPTIEELENDLHQLESKRSRLIDAGFFAQEQGVEDKDLQKVDAGNIDVISVYIKDVKQKLSIFDDLTEKIELIVKIINSRFLYKKLSISNKDGFVFKTPVGKILPLTSLSSGEQHELVLLYELLFKVKSNSLILIDEPELSLHVAWQAQFLNDLEQITRLAGFDVLIATHSPDIIQERWDLSVELKGTQQ